VDGAFLALTFYKAYHAGLHLCSPVWDRKFRAVAQCIQRRSAGTRNLGSVSASLCYSDWRICVATSSGPLSAAMSATFAL